MLKNRSFMQFIVLTAVLIAVMIVSVVGLRAFAVDSIHKERTIYLSAQTDTTANLIDETVTRYTENSSIYKPIIEKALSEETEINALMSRLYEELYLNEARLILVDTSGTWYGNEGTSGKITSLSSYSDRLPEEVIYITTGVDVKIESLCCRMKLDSSCAVDTPNGKVDIAFFTLIYYSDLLVEKIKASFPYTCNSFIVDEQGTMLYKNFELSRLISGSNLFSKYERCDFVHGKIGSMLLSEIKDGKTVAEEMIIDGENYYICTAPLSVNQWYVSFVVKSDDLSAGSYVNSMFVYIVLIGVVFALSLGFSGAFLLRLKDRTKLYEKEKAANEFLEKAARAKGEFLSNMSHDIRTPINGIMGMTRIAELEDNPPRTQDCLRKIEISSRYLLSLVTDVLEMSNLDDNGVKIRQESVYLPEYLEDCVEIIRNQAEDKKIHFVTDFSAIVHPFILADAVRLNQIFINILGNSLKFTPEDGTISFLVRETAFLNGKISFIFVLKDTGIGMEKEFLTHIWDRFSQGKAGARSEYKGTGLGMAITKGLVDAMDGEIFVESEVGLGTTFTILLSFHEDTEKTANAPEASPRDVRGMHILLAEDNEINREIATELLSREGILLDQAANGEEALQKFTEHDAHTYDAILMDVMMPVMNGLDATKKIRSSGKEDADTVPIIAMTANMMDDDKSAMKAAGMNAYLGKPFDTEAVLATLSSFRKGGTDK